MFPGFGWLKELVDTNTTGSYHFANLLDVPLLRCVTFCSECQDWNVSAPCLLVKKNTLRLAWSGSLAAMHSLAKWILRLRSTRRMDSSSKSIKMKVCAIWCSISASLLNSLWRPVYSGRRCIGPKQWLSLGDCFETFNLTLLQLIVCVPESFTSFASVLSLKNNFFHLEMSPGLKTYDIAMPIYQLLGSEIENEFYMRMIFSSQ